MRIGNLTITFDKKKKPTVAMTNEEIAKRYETGLQSGKQLILGTLSGRSGTRFLCALFSAHANASGITERYALGESFYRYVHFNQLPIDTAGIITLIKKGIVEDWEQKDISLVFSPYFSHGIDQLIKELQPSKIIFAISELEFTVQSMYNKGLFDHDYIYHDPEKIVGYQQEFGESWSHYFGRVIPRGQEYKSWSALTRIGKISWFANRMMVDIHAQLKQADQNNIVIFDLQKASGNYEYYRAMAQSFGLSPIMSSDKFFAIERQWFKKAHNIRHEWSGQERAEFEAQTKESQEIYRTLSQQ